MVPSPAGQPNRTHDNGKLGSSDWSGSQLGPQRSVSDWNGSGRSLEQQKFIAPLGPSTTADQNSTQRLGDRSSIVAGPPSRGPSARFATGTVTAEVQRGGLSAYKYAGHKFPGPACVGSQLFQWWPDRQQPGGRD